MLSSNKTTDGTLIEHLTKGSMKTVPLVCDECGKPSATQWNNYVQGQRKRGWTGETYCQPCAARRSGLACKGVPNPAVVQSNQDRRGDAHPSWNGGRYVDNHGYVMVSTRSGRGPGSGWDNYRKEHTVVLEKHLGRALQGGDVVHHIDGDKTNNKISNLWLTTQAGHRTAHLSLQGIGYMLLRAGLIVFDPNTGSYHPTDQLQGHTHDP